ncbi:hypothetical protein Ljor_0264 [Legionella jordanis]|uniref:Uncharacterized protein n=1 Tax=Legionella jordanis TaxID=456 RepID=A0A0W0VG03_9GAMM|nr:hypothetical protein Ljor_0264 [Legionella jordanis]VEH13144.1 Uncharacterised protein [Legionella jordanis]
MLDVLAQILASQGQWFFCMTQIFWGLNRAGRDGIVVVYTTVRAKHDYLITPACHEPNYLNFAHHGALESPLSENILY